MDDEFAREVLRLAEGQSIEDFEQDLKAQAQRLDVSATPLATTPDAKDVKQTSSLTSSTQPRRSVSTGSQGSQSTGITDISHTSKDKLHARVPVQRGRRNSANSVTIRDYDQLVNHPRYDRRRTSFNFSTSPLSPSPSAFSLSNGWSFSREASPKRHILRGLSRLRLRRTDSNESAREKDDCPHCPQNGSRHRRILHTLPCGHRYCTMALRRLIKGSLDNDNVPPACCKRPIPGSLVASVMSQEEQDALMNRLVACEDVTPVGYFGNEIPIVTNSRDVSKSRPSSRSSMQATINVLRLQEQNQNLEKALTLPHFQELRQTQEQQREDVLSWAARKSQIIKEDHSAKKIDLFPGFANQKEELLVKHTNMLAHVEDKHVLDEHEMRQDHEIESRNNAIALKHMEAYCKGETTSGESHVRPITDQDLRELAKARRMRDQMAARHAGAISVLRGEQSRRISQRLLKNGEEFAQLEQAQLKELDNIQQDCDTALQTLDEEVKTIQAQMQKWWTLQTEIWRKNLEKETGISFTGALPPIIWPGDEEEQAVAEKKVFEKTSTATRSPVRDIKTSDGACPSKSLSPPRRPNRFSTAFSFRGSIIGKAIG